MPPITEPETTNDEPTLGVRVFDRDWDHHIYPNATYWETDHAQALQVFDDDDEKVAEFAAGVWVLVEAVGSTKDEIEADEDE